MPPVIMPWNIDFWRDQWIYVAEAEYSQRSVDEQWHSPAASSKSGNTFSRRMLLLNMLLLNESSAFVKKKNNCRSTRSGSFAVF